jgi:hypothetical protein
VPDSNKFAQELKKELARIFQEMKPEPEHKIGQLKTKPSYTTIWLSKDTKAKLNDLRQRGATYEDVINFLLNFYKRNKSILRLF